MLPSLELEINAPRILLLSLHPVYAKRFFDKSKQIELRRTRPRLSRGDFVIFYVTTPEQAIRGGGRVDEVLEMPPRRLWQKAANRSGIDRPTFDAYFQNCDTGYGISFDRIWEFPRGILRSTIARRWPDFRPPQLYQYLTVKDAERLGVIAERHLLRATL
jgi:predicted transcriptional regulator